MAAIGSVERYTPEKDEVIRSLVRRAPDCDAVCEVVEALSVFPQKALERIRDFGTRIEVYDHDGGEEFPNYMPTLSHPQVVGAYNTVANVLGIENDNLSPFVLIHETTHALDASLGNLSDQPHWRGGHKLASTTNQVVRPYAKHDPSEYMAENATAYLVKDEALYSLVEEGWEKGLATAGLSDREYLQMHQNLSHARLQRVDPNGFQLVDEMFKSLEVASPPPNRPAMDEQNFGEWLQSRSAA